MPPLPHRSTSPMEPTTEQLVKIVTNVARATSALSADERQAYEHAQRSVVEARSSAEADEDHIRIL
jgi:hypothetical protein